jgi:hypothetical protein
VIYVIDYYAFLAWADLVGWVLLSWEEVVMIELEVALLDYQVKSIYDKLSKNSIMHVY